MDGESTYTLDMALTANEGKNKVFHGEQQCDFQRAKAASQKEDKVPYYKRVTLSLIHI